MASSGHQSSVTSLEVVPSVAGGQKLEASLLASEEGMEWKKNDQHNIRDPVYHFINVQNDFWVVVVVSCFTVTVSHHPESSGLSFQLASLDETGVLNFWVG